MAIPIHPLAAYRKRHDLTQQALADRLAAADIRLSQQAIDRYERWLNVPRLARLRKLAAFLGVPITRLLPPQGEVVHS